MASFRPGLGVACLTLAALAWLPALRGFEEVRYPSLPQEAPFEPRPAEPFDARALLAEQAAPRSDEEPAPWPSWVMHRRPFVIPLPKQR